MILWNPVPIPLLTIVCFFISCFAVLQEVRCMKVMVAHFFYQNSSLFEKSNRFYELIYLYEDTCMYTNQICSINCKFRICIKYVSILPIWLEPNKLYLWVLKHLLTYFVIYYVVNNVPIMMLPMYVTIRSYL